jgi:hypothetical protein
MSSETDDEGILSRMRPLSGHNSLSQIDLRFDLPEPGKNAHSRLGFSVPQKN